MERNFAFIHDPGCGKPAFYLEALPEPGSPMRSNLVEMPDGKHPEPGSAVVCGACGKKILGPNSPGSLSSAPIVINSPAAEESTAA